MTIPPDPTSLPTTPAHAAAPPFPAPKLPTRCPVCDYDTTGLTDPRCPECGCDIPHEYARRGNPKPVFLAILLPLLLGNPLWLVAAFSVASVQAHYTGSPYTTEPVSVFIYATAAVVPLATLLALIYRTTLRHTNHALFVTLATFAWLQALPFFLLLCLLGGSL